MDRTCKDCKSLDLSNAIKYGFWKNTAPCTHEEASQVTPNRFLKAMACDCFEQRK